MKKKATFKSLSMQLLMLLFVFGSLQLSAGNNPNSELPDDKKDLNNTNWQLYQENTGIQIYFKSVACHDEHNGIHQQFIILKFVNTTETDLALSWDAHLWYDGECVTCKDTRGEYSYQLILKGGENSEGNCASGYEFKIFSRFLNYDDKPELTNFELAKLSISPQ